MSYDYDSADPSTGATLAVVLAILVTAMVLAIWALYPAPENSFKAYCEQYAGQSIPYAEWSRCRENGWIK